VASLLVGAATRRLSTADLDSSERERLRVVRCRGWDLLPFESDHRLYEAAIESLATSESRVPLDDLVPPPRRRSGPPVASWAVGVTTAERREPTLDYCLTSLAKAGWTEPVLFVDGDVQAPGLDGHSITRRRPRVGAWPNYFLAFAELLMRHPAADAYLMLQDDAVLAARPIRSYLERVLWPGREPGIVSLFCPSEYTQRRAGWHEFRGAWFWGAQAFAYSRQAAVRFLSNEFVIRHRWSPRTGGLANIDWLIGEWAVQERIPVYYPTPSLVQHIGRTSAIWNAAPLSGSRLADRVVK
jgi:hypothetical protein